MVPGLASTELRPSSGPQGLGSPFQGPATGGRRSEDRRIVPRRDPDGSVGSSNADAPDPCEQALRLAELDELHEH